MREHEINKQIGGENVYYIVYKPAITYEDTSLYIQLKIKYLYN
jgi:hypothetical protein